MVKEAAAILITAQGANFGAAEKAVTVAGYDVVSRVAEDFGQELQEECGGSPEAWELLQDEEDGVGAGEQTFVGELVVEGDIDRVENARIDAVAGEDGGGERALQRRETEDGIAIAAKNELDEAVAESAAAVVEEDGVGHARR